MANELTTELGPERFAPGLERIVPIEYLEGWPGNYREHDLGAIAESLRRWGQQRPVLVQLLQGPDGELARRPRIIAGHGILEAARSLGWKRIGITFTDLADGEAQAYLVADNRTHDLGRDDPDRLVELLRTIPDLTATGFDPDDLDRLMVAVARDRSEIPAERERCPTCGRYL